MNEPISSAKASIWAGHDFLTDWDPFTYILGPELNTEPLFHGVSEIRSFLAEVPASSLEIRIRRLMSGCDCG